MTLKARNIASLAVTAAKMADGVLDSTSLAAGIVAAAKLDATATGAISNVTDGLLTLRVARVTFDATNVAGNRTVAPHAPGPVTIPEKGWVVGGFYDVTTTFTDGVADLATIAISVEAANDIVNAITIADGTTPWTAGKHAIIPKGNTPESTGIKATVARDITFTVGAVALTAGVLTLFLYFVVAA